MRQPGRAAGRRLVVVTHAGEDHHGGLHGPGGTAGVGGLAPERLAAPPRTGPGPGRGGPTRRPRRRPAAGPRRSSLRTTAAPRTRRALGRTRSPARPLHPRRPAAGPRPRRGAGPGGGSPPPARSYSPSWMPTPSPSTKRPPERSWSAVACFATASGRRRGSCSTHVPRVGRLVATAATARVVSDSPMGWGQKRWSTAQSESAPVASARRQSSTRSGALPVPPAVLLEVAPGLERSSPCVVGGRMSPRDGWRARLPTGVTPT